MCTFCGRDSHIGGKQMKAKIFAYGNFWSPSRESRKKNALSALNGKILCVGTYDECIDSFPKGIKPKVVDLEGKTILPGFIDSHMHLLNFGLTLRDISLTNVTSIVSLKTKIKHRANEVSDTQWIIGRGWDQEIFDEKRYPTRKDLDEASQGKPVYLTRACGHISVASSKVLKIAGITKDTQNPSGGTIDRDSYGEPTGILRETAQGLVQSHVPKVGPAAMEEALLKASQYVVSKGITTVHTNDGQAGFPGTMELYEKICKQKASLRVYWDIPSSFMPDMFKTPIRTGDGNDFLRIGAIKFFADGSLGGRTAALETSYSDDLNNRGILVISEDQLKEAVYVAHAHGMQVAIHAIGDRGTRVSLDAITSAQAKLPLHDIRHRIVHAQILSPLLISEMKRAKIVADIQPIFISTDMRWALARVGSTRMRSSYSWHTMLKAGIPLAGGSDCPVEPPDPLFGIYCAVTRKDLFGNPPAGFFPNEKLTLNEAVNLFTMGGAYAEKQEHKKGSLVPGKLCDFVALSDDIKVVKPEDIKDLEVVLTVIGGEIAYKKP